MGRLLREDAPDDAELILRQLRRAGYDLDTLRVKTAIAMVNALCDRDWDLVLSDYELPGLGGSSGLEGLDVITFPMSGARIDK